MELEAPEGMGSHGRSLWSGVTKAYELRVDELMILEAAAGEADLIAALKAGLVDEPQLVKGSQGQLVIHPVISELRQHRLALKALLAQLKLPDENSSDQGGELSAKNRAAANARWARRGA